MQFNVDIIFCVDNQKTFIHISLKVPAVNQHTFTKNNEFVLFFLNGPTTASPIGHQNKLHDCEYYGLLKSKNNAKLQSDTKLALWSFLISCSVLG